MNKELRTKARNDFEDFLELINNSISGKAMKNVRKCKDIELVTNDRRRSHLVS